MKTSTNRRCRPALAPQFHLNHHVLARGRARRSAQSYIFMKMLKLICCASIMMPMIALSQDSAPAADLLMNREIELKRAKDEDCGVAKDDAIRIKFLEPLHECGFGSGEGWSPDEGPRLHFERSRAGDHGFVYTTEGDLFVDNFFVGRFGASDDLRYGFGRFWANGKPCVLMPLTDRQKHQLYDDGWKTPVQLAAKRWKLFVTPSSGSAGGERYAADGDVIDWAEGMTIVRFEKGSFYLQGVSYGKVSEGDEIRVEYGIVTINGKLRSPEVTDGKGGQAPNDSGRMEVSPPPTK